MYKRSSCPFVTTERTKSKNGEKLQRTLSCNAKEEILLNKRLRFLESMKKQAEASFTFDQRMLYNRFSVKLRRSEVAHAKLFGNRNLVNHLSQSLFPNLHTVVTDTSEKAVRIILQNAEAFRAISAPCRSQLQLVPTSVAKNHDCKDLQSKEIEVKNQQMLLEAAKETNTRQTLRGVISATKTISISNGQMETSQSENVLRHRKSRTAHDEKCNGLPSVNCRYHYVLGRIATPEAVGGHMSLSPKEREDRNPTEGFLGQKNDSKNKKTHRRRPNSRNLFLGLNNIPGRRYSSRDNHMMADNHSILNSKVKLFVAKMRALKCDESHPLQDY